MIAECKNCYKEFKTFPSRAKMGKGVFCSKSCWQEYHCVTLTCKECGKKYLYPKSQTQINFCSKKCMTLFRGKNKEEKVCECCGKKFLSYKHRKKENRGRYCSSKCYWESLKLPEEQRNENRRKYTREYRRRNGDKCAVWKHTRRALSKDAGGTFTEREWKALKAKHNHLCAICGKRKKLTVDHIIPLKGWRDWQRQNSVDYLWNDIDNIQPLCVNCNSQKSWLIK